MKAVMSLVLRNIRHSYGSGLVVDGASLEAAPGEIVCLFGPSGCGKTTLLRVAAGLERLQEGSVELDGTALATPQKHVEPEKRPIGFVLQDYVLFPHLTVAQNIAFGLKDLPAAERAARIADELSAVDLQPFADRYPHELSGGQQQRAALARAFARRPRAMLLDEPFASIDVALRQRLRAEMRRILKTRATPAILVTHDPVEAVELGDRIAVMRAGRIIEAGPPRSLYDAPKTVAAATIFPGSQAIACAAGDGGVDTAFGLIRIGARPADAAHLVIREGGATAFADSSGVGRVVDCRFAGPGWTVTLIDVETGAALLKASAAEPIAAGERAGIRFDPDQIRALAS